MDQNSLNLPTLIRLPKAYPPSRVLADPQLLQMSIEDYFSMLTATPADQPKRHPTPPGLAMAMGLRSFDALMQIMKEEEASPGTHPPDSMDVLHIARSHLEAYYLENGLREAIPTQFLRFIMSAYFGRSEKIMQEQIGASDNNIQINILGVSNPMPEYVQNTSGSSPSNDNTLNHTILPTDGGEVIEVNYAHLDDDRSQDDEVEGI